jgi:hypothetical protein
LAVTLFASASFARIEVAFLEAWTSTGKKVELEKDGRFAHVAIRYEGQWFHASPRKGAELTTDIKVFGPDRTLLSEILVDDDAPDLTGAQIAEVIGLPYDFKFRWEDEYGTYCSKLVGKLLQVPPTPMTFDGSYWNGIKNLPWGEPGISPDGLYKVLKARGYISAQP